MRFNISPEHTTPPQDAIKVFGGGIMDPLIEYIEGMGRSESFELILSLIRTCSLFRASFDYGLVSDLLMRQALLRLVVFAQQKKAGALLREAVNNPERLQSLLCGKALHSVKNPWGKTFFEITAFQLALCEGDVEMSEMLERYFRQIPGGLEAMYRQMLEVFPEGLPEQEGVDPPHVVRQKQRARDFAEQILRPLGVEFSSVRLRENDVFNILYKKDVTSPFSQELANFRERIRRLSVEDRVYNPYYLLEIIAFYRIFFFNFGVQQISNERLRLFCIRVFGTVQFHASACDLQVFAQGIPSGTNCLRRSFHFGFKLRSNSPACILTDQQEGRLRLGVDYWASISVSDFQGHANDDSAGAGIQGGMAPNDLPNFNQKKVERLRRLFNRCRPTPEPVVSASAVTP